MERKRKFFVYGVIIFAWLFLFFGFYVIPYIPQLAIPGYTPDEIANEISYMNYLLTLLATLGTISGLAFTVFGYFQTTKVPSLVREEVDKWLQQFLQQQLDEIHDRAATSLKALQYMAEPSILGGNGYPVTVESRIKNIDNARKVYPDLWGVNYYKAMIYWYGQPTERRYKETAMVLMHRHVLKHPEHEEAWIELIKWHLEKSEHTRALTNLEKMLDVHPHLVKTVDQLIVWNLNDEQTSYKKEIMNKAKEKLSQSADENAVTTNTILRAVERFFPEINGSRWWEKRMAKKTKAKFTDFLKQNLRKEDEHLEDE